jgi:hypothetical protein
MEEALDTLDTRDAQASDPLPNKALMSRAIDESGTDTSPHGTRAELLDKVEEDLVKYGKQRTYYKLLYHSCKSQASYSSKHSNLQWRTSRQPETIRAYTIILLLRSPFWKPIALSLSILKISLPFDQVVKVLG